MMSLSFKNFIPAPLTIPAQAKAAPLSSDSTFPVLRIVNCSLKIYLVLSSKNLEILGIHLQMETLTNSEAPLPIGLMRSCNIFSKVRINFFYPFLSR